MRAEAEGVYGLAELFISWCSEGYPSILSDTIAKLSAYDLHLVSVRKVNESIESGIRRAWPIFVMIQEWWPDSQEGHRYVDDAIDQSDVVRFHQSLTFTDGCSNS